MRLVRKSFISYKKNRKGIQMRETAKCRRRIQLPARWSAENSRVRVAETKWPAALRSISNILLSQMWRTHSCFIKDYKTQDICSSISTVSPALFYFIAAIWMLETEPPSSARAGSSRKPRALFSSSRNLCIMKENLLQAVCQRLFGRICAGRVKFLGYYMN